MVRRINQLIGTKSEFNLNIGQTSILSQIKIDNIVGIELFKEKQLELIEKINLRDGRNRQQKSINQLNAYLIDNFDMTVLSKPKYKVIDGKKKKLTYLIDYYQMKM